VGQREDCYINIKFDYDPTYNFSSLIGIFHVKDFPKINRNR